MNNIIAIPHGKGSVHAQISGHYNSKPKDLDGLTVRQWLSNQSFEKQFEYGMNQLKKYGDVRTTPNGYIFIPHQ